MGIKDDLGSVKRGEKIGSSFKGFGPNCRVGVMRLHGFMITNAHRQQEWGARRLVAQIGGIRVENESMN